MVENVIDALSKEICLDKPQIDPAFHLFWVTTLMLVEREQRHQKIFESIEGGSLSVDVVLVMLKLVVALLLVDVVNVVDVVDVVVDVVVTVVVVVKK